LDWLDRAEQAREVAGRLTDGARKAAFELADSFNWLAQAAASAAMIRQRDLVRQGQKATPDCAVVLPESIEGFRELREWLT
jgi:hypothetical protein